jgi:endonuclease/exonuclease/phosphatase family metal-dependent hydrolase
LDIRLSPAIRPKFALNAPRRATTIGIVLKKCLSVYRAEGHTSHITETAGHSTLGDMSSILQILQLNVRKQSMVQQSLMNDEKLRDFGVLAITEPHVWKQGDTLVIVPMGHSNWTRMTPTVQEEGR